MSEFSKQDNILIQDTIKWALQIKEKIETTTHKVKQPPEALPDSLVPTDILYDIVACFEAMHTMLLDLELIKTGNLKSNRNNIH